MHRRSPRKHSVHTRHPRYTVPVYSRGSGAPPVNDVIRTRELFSLQDRWIEHYQFGDQGQFHHLTNKDRSKIQEHTMDAMREMSSTDPHYGYVYEKLDRVEDTYLSDYISWNYSNPGFDSTSSYFDFLHLNSGDKRILGKWRYLERRHLRPRYREIADPRRRKAIVDLMNLAVIESQDSPRLGILVRGYLKARDSMNQCMIERVPDRASLVREEYGTDPRGLSPEQRLKALLVSVKERMLAAEYGLSGFKPALYGADERLKQILESRFETTDRIRSIHYENRRLQREAEERSERLSDRYYERIHKAHSNASLVLIQSEIENDAEVTPDMARDFKQYISRTRSERGL